MPTYSFENTKTEKQWSEMMTNAEREKFLKDNPDVIQILSAIPNLYTAGSIKTDGGWKELLGRIKSGNKGSTIDPGNLTQI